MDIRERRGSSFFLAGWYYDIPSCECPWLEFTSSCVVLVAVVIPKNKCCCNEQPHMCVLCATATLVPCQVNFLEVELRVGTKPVLSEDKIPLDNDDSSFIPSLRWQESPRPSLRQIILAMWWAFTKLRGTKWMIFQCSFNFHFAFYEF